MATVSAEPLDRCPICGEARADDFRINRLIVGRGQARLELRLVECQGCHHVFVNPQPIAEELAPFYDSSYFVFANPLADIDRCIATLRRGDRFNHALVVPGGRYLDIGCGLGAMVASMQRLGMEAYGVEPSAIAVERGRSVGLNIVRGLLHEAAFPDAHFDVVTMYHVLEHVPAPVDVLRECHRILKPEGELLIGVPNIASLVLDLVGRTWSALDPPRHLHHFRAASLKRACERSGLQVRTLETESLSEHVEQELATWLRRRLLVPSRLTIKTHIARPAAAYLARIGASSGRGEALIAVCQKVQAAADA